MATQRTYSLYAKEAVALLGEQIKIGRKKRRWTETNLCQRADISRRTLQKIESGKMGCAIGLVFEVAALVNIPLFNSDKLPLSYLRELTHVEFLSNIIILSEWEILQLFQKYVNLR